MSLRDQAHSGTLTDKQSAALNLVKEGLGDKEIAELLGVSRGAVSNRITHGILPRLGANNRAHAVYLAMTRGILDW
ncbi:hypothetical protein LCGC14_2074300 [marine sediment metagenome]|uniref:HTH luxR-type domain-containing protein n=1 Tax=marine sediment metagenome TaxID=412755 RepID=A0A0F9EHP3_9ZZZZ